MNTERQEQLLDLMIKRSVYGLTDEESALLSDIEAESDDAADSSIDVTISGISLIDSPRGEKLPADLQARIISDANRFFDAKMPSAEPGTDGRYARAGSSVAAARNFWDWFGWAVAAAACFALIINIWLTRIQPGPEIGGVRPSPSPTRALTAAERRLKMMESNPDMIKASWSGGNYPGSKEVEGDIVWSDSEQAGYMRFQGLPVNDREAETYQLWIFDESQDEKTPIDGGTFDIDQNGEVVIPVNAKLTARHPKMFAVTMEKPGGVVVSKREKVVAIGKLET